MLAISQRISSSTRLSGVPTRDPEQFTSAPGYPLIDEVLVAFLLVLLLILVELPIGMGHLGDCPACTSTTSSLTLRLCAGILATVALTFSFFE